jgi:heptosyltransferase-3
MFEQYKNQRIKTNLDWFKQPFLDMQRWLSSYSYRVLLHYFGTRQRKKPDSIERLLIIRRNRLGDAISLIPTIKEIKRKNSNIQIDVLATPYNSIIFKYMTEVENVYEVPERYLKNRFLTVLHVEFRKAKSLEYDVIVTSSPSFSSASAWLSLNLVAGFRIGVTSKRGSLWDLVYDEQHSHLQTNPNEHQVVRVGRLFSTLRVDPCSSKLPEATFSAKKIHGNGRLIALCPIVARVESQWPQEHWIALGRLLAQSGYQYIWIGKGFDKEMTKHARNSEELVDCLKACDVVICCEGGVSHLAPALGKATVVMSGMRIAGSWSPWAKSAILYERPGDVAGINPEIILKQVNAYRDTAEFIMDSDSYICPCD